MTVVKKERDRVLSLNLGKAEDNIVRQHAVSVKLNVIVKLSLASRLYIYVAYSE